MSTNIFANLELPVAIVGLGVSGSAALNLLQAAGIPSESILTFDEKSPMAQFRNPIELMEQGQPKTLVVSPGVPLASTWIQSAQARGIFITSELSLAHRFITSERIIAITGSVGKSTTTCLLRAGLEKFCPSYFVGGNLGFPLAIYALELLQGLRPKAEWIVLELSSYQLENYPELKAKVSIITHLTSNHLERYLNKEEYFRTKWNLEKQTQELMILNKNGGELTEWASANKPLLPWVWTDRQSPLVTEFHLKDCKLLGSHNLDNISLAAEAAHHCGWPATAYDGIRNFAGLSHRVENLGTIDGIRYINDSKATTMESVKIAVQSTLETISNSNFLHLLLGGKDKNLPWEELHSLIGQKNIKFYFFGQCASIAQNKSALPGTQYQKMVDAAAGARIAARNGDSVLLSPGGTSLDEFKNFEQRGDVYRAFALK